MTTQPADALAEALLDEYKARATYRAVIRAFGEVRPFVNIVNAEERHVRALLPLFDRYGIPAPADEFAATTSAPASLKEACREAVRAEIDNARMYDRLLEATGSYPGVQAVLRRLQRASAGNHLPAFRRCLDRLEASGRDAGRQRRHRGGRSGG